MNWENAEKRKAPLTVEGRIFQTLRKLEQLRDAHRVFDGAADVRLLETGDDGVLGIEREFCGEKLAALFNFSETERRMPLREPGEYRDLMSGEAVGSDELLLPPGGFCWLIRDSGEE